MEDLEREKGRKAEKNPGVGGGDGVGRERERKRKTGAGRERRQGERGREGGKQGGEREREGLDGKSVVPFLTDTCTDQMAAWSSTWKSSRH